jgi:hypothetical protein
MPSVSKAQQALMGAAHEYNKTGKLPDSPSFAAQVKKVADSMKPSKT